MSLKTLLAVGESFSGTEAAPYEVRKEKLPVFEKKGNGTDGELDFQKREKVRLMPERRTIESEPEERRSFLRRRERVSPGRAEERKLTQAEMRLEQVQVVRNDLSDSDLELAPRRAPRAAESSSDLNPFAPRPIAAIGRPSHDKLNFGARVTQWLRFLKRPKS